MTATADEILWAATKEAKRDQQAKDREFLFNCAQVWDTRNREETLTGPQVAELLRSYANMMR